MKLLNPKYPNGVILETLPTLGNYEQAYAKFTGLMIRVIYSTAPGVSVLWEDGFTSFYDHEEIELYFKPFEDQVGAQLIWELKQESHKYY